MTALYIKNLFHCSWQDTTIHYGNLTLNYSNSSNTQTVIPPYLDLAYERNFSTHDELHITPKMMIGIEVTHMMINAAPAKLGFILSLGSAVGLIADSILISFGLLLVMEELVDFFRPPIV